MSGRHGGRIVPHGEGNYMIAGSVVNVVAMVTIFAHPGSAAGEVSQEYSLCHIIATMQL